LTLSSMDYWRLSDELSVVDAALLTVGHNPGEVRPYGNDITTAEIETISSDEQYGRRSVDDEGFRG